MKYVIVFLLCCLAVSISCQQQSETQAQSQSQNGCAGCASAGDCAKKAVVTAKVTFVELGSVNCIPCKAMQPVMKAIEENFGDQIYVVFHDVKKEPSLVKKFNIGLIPTQVFLDEHGKEFHRHEGFYPEAEITKILIAQGLMPKSGQDS